MYAMMPPDTWVEWVRLIIALAGIGTVVFLLRRLIGGWPTMGGLTRCMVLLLVAAAVAFGMGSARAAQIDAPWNYWGFLGLAVNLGAFALGVWWQRVDLLWPRTGVSSVTNPRHPTEGATP